MRWTESWRADPKARELADRHYNRQKVGSKQFVPPGRCIVLVTDDGKAFWISAYPIARYVQHAWAGAWMCTESWEGGAPPALGFVSFVDPSKTKPKADPGYCYARAGWTRLEERTQEDNLVVYQLLPADMPPPAPPKRLRTPKRSSSMTNALSIPPETQAELASEADRTKEAMGLLQAFQIVDHATHAKAGAMVQNANARIADLEAKRTSITVPILEAKRAVDALFNPITGPLKQAVVILKSKIGMYELSQRQLQERAMQAAAAAIQAGQPQQAVAHVAAIAPAAPIQGITVKPWWNYEVIDENAVPRAYCSPDHAKIMAALPNAMHGNKVTPQIPGLRIFLDSSVTARKAK